MQSLIFIIKALLTLSIIETIESFELLRRAVTAEENEMKVATNLWHSTMKVNVKHLW